MTYILMYSSHPGGLDYVCTLQRSGLYYRQQFLWSHSSTCRINHCLNVFWLQSGFVDECSGIVCSHTNQRTHTHTHMHGTQVAQITVVSVPLQVASVFFYLFHPFDQAHIIPKWMWVCLSPYLMLKETATREKCTLDRWRVRKKTKQPE